MFRSKMFLPLLAAVFATIFFYVEADITAKYGTCVEQQLTIDEIRSHPTHPKRKSRSFGFVAPDSFNAAEQWPGCTSISTIRDQGSCGTCWAVSSAAVIADRRCVASGQQEQDFTSSTRLAGCAYPDKSPKDACEVGGDKGVAFKFVKDNGGVTGGEYNSDFGCLPYFVPHGGKAPVTCPNQCSNPSYDVDMQSDAGNHPVEDYWMIYDRDMTIQSNIDANVILMQEEIMTNGPIGASLNVDDNFQQWTGGEPYTGPNTWDSSLNSCRTNHAIRLTGWGVSDLGTRYWIIANSWSANSGQNGFYHIAMGVNAAGIECKIAAPIIAGTSRVTNDDPQPSQDDPIWTESVKKINTQIKLDI